MATNLKELQITMTMWGMSKSSRCRISKKLMNGENHTFKNGMSYVYVSGDIVSPFSYSEKIKIKRVA